MGVDVIELNVTMKLNKFKKFGKTVAVFLVLGLFLLLFIEGAWAEEIIIEKTAPEEIRIGEILSVDIKIHNKLSEAVPVTLNEMVEDAEPIDPPELITPEAPSGKITWFPPYYEWKFTLEPNSEKVINYKIKPLNLGYYIIGPTKAYTYLGTFRSNPLTVFVRCNANGICEWDINENSINCPEDCPLGFPDEICDPIRDGICDPDCAPSVDPDCIKAKCGDGKCEKLKGENYENCPQDCPKPVICGDDICEEKENYGNCPEDCPSGGRDNYCDAIKDGICDPDCSPKIDPDCPGACGNNKCEYMEGENYFICPEDCPSGSLDNYCDGLDDGICDPDCMGGEDPDCKGMDILPYITLTLVIIIIIFLIYRKLKAQKGEEE